MLERAPSAPPAPAATSSAAGSSAAATSVATSSAAPAAEAAYYYYSKKTLVASLLGNGGRKEERWMCTKRPWNETLSRIFWAICSMSSAIPEAQVQQCEKTAYPVQGKGCHF